MEHRAQVFVEDGEKKRALHGEIYSAKTNANFSSASLLSQDQIAFLNYN
jgi:hypothetical protein